MEEILIPALLQDAKNFQIKYYNLCTRSYIWQSTEKTTFYNTPE